jgi:hypothetical protein
MKRTKGDKLFNLIKSLSKHEKGYFRKFSRIYSASAQANYIDLFDFMDKMDEYDESAIKAKFKNKKWITHLAVLKQYLFQQILRSLHVYQTSGENDESTLFYFADILSKRGLHEDALYYLKKGQAVAEKNENYPCLLVSLSKETILTRSNLRPGGTDVIYDPIRKRRQQLRDTINDLMEVQQLNEDMHNLHSTIGTIRDSSLEEELTMRLNPDLIERVENSGSAYMKRTFYSAMLMYYSLLSDTENFYKYNKKHFELLEANKAVFEGSFLFRHHIYFNYLQSCIVSGRYEEFEEQMKLFQEMKVNSHFTKVQKFYMVNHLLFTYIRVSQKTPLINSLYKKFKTEYPAVAGHLSAYERLSILLNISYLLYKAGRLDEAIYWNNEGLSLEKDCDRDDYKTGFRIQDLLFHFDANSYRLLSSKILSTQRLLQKSGSLYSIEQCIISYLKQLIKDEDQDARKELFENFRTELNQLSHSDKAAKHFLDFFGVIDWIDSKLT